MAVQPSTLFERAASGLLTSTVKVIAANRTATKTGSVAEPAREVITGLKASVQPRASLDAQTVLGRLPEMTHMMYCRGEDADATVLDIHKGDRVEETDGTRRKFRIMTEPERYPDPFRHERTCYLAMELQEMVYG